MASNLPSSAIEAKPPVDRAESPTDILREQNVALSKLPSLTDKTSSPGHHSPTDEAKPMSSPLKNKASSPSVVENMSSRTEPSSVDQAESRVDLAREENTSKLPSAASKAKSPERPPPSDGAKPTTQSPLEDSIALPTSPLPKENVSSSKLPSLASENNIVSSAKPSPSDKGTPPKPPSTGDKTKSPMPPSSDKRETDGQPKAPPAKRYKGVPIYPRGVLEERQRQKEAEAAHRTAQSQRLAESRRMHREERERQKEAREIRMWREEIRAEVERIKEEEESKQNPSSFPLPEPGRLRCRMCGASYDRENNYGCPKVKGE